jgi:glucokinase
LTKVYAGVDVGGTTARSPRKTMAEAAEASAERIREAIVRAAGYLGIGISNMITALHPDLVVLGGGVAGIGPLLFDTVRAVVRERVRMLPTEDIRIEPSLLGDKAGVLGAIALAMKGGLKDCRSKRS